MNLRTSLIPTVVVLTGGIVGLFLSNVSIGLKIVLTLIGAYLDFVLIGNAIDANERINKNIGVMRNGYK